MWRGKPEKGELWIRRGGYGKNTHEIAVTRVEVIEDQTNVPAWRNGCVGGDWRRSTGRNGGQAWRRRGSSRIEVNEAQPGLKKMRNGARAAQPRGLLVAEQPKRTLAEPVARISLCN